MRIGGFGDTYNKRPHQANFLNVKTDISSGQSNQKPLEFGMAATGVVRSSQHAEKLLRRYAFQQKFPPGLRWLTSLLDSKAKVVVEKTNGSIYNGYGASAHLLPVPDEIRLKSGNYTRARVISDKARDDFWRDFRWPRVWFQPRPVVKGIKALGIHTNYYFHEAEPRPVTAVALSGPHAKSARVRPITREHILDWLGLPTNNKFKHEQRLRVQRCKLPREPELPNPHSPPLVEYARGKYKEDDGRLLTHDDSPPDLDLLKPAQPQRPLPAPVLYRARSIREEDLERILAAEHRTPGQDALVKELAQLLDGALGPADTKPRTVAELVKKHGSGPQVKSRRARHRGRYVPPSLDIPPERRTPNSFPTRVASEQTDVRSTSTPRPFATIKEHYVDGQEVIVERVYGAVQPGESFPDLVHLPETGQAEGRHVVSSLPGTTPVSQTTRNPHPRLLQREPDTVASAMDEAARRAAALDPASDAVTPGQQPVGELLAENEQARLDHRAYPRQRTVEELLAKNEQAHLGDRTDRHRRRRPSEP